MLTKRERRINTTVAISAVLFFCILLIFTWKYEKTVDRTLHGIEFRSGDLKTYTIKSIQLKGKIFKAGLLGKNQFEGNIYIDGKACDNTNGSTLFSIGRGNGASISYGNYEGTLCTGDNYEELTIMIHGEIGKHTQEHDLKLGTYFSAPCKDREEALRIAVKLLKKTFGDLDLK